MGLQLLDVELGFFAFAGPDDRAALAVDLHHQNVGLLLLVTENFHEHEGDVGHEIYGIIVNDDVPRHVKGGRFLGVS